MKMTIKALLLGGSAMVFAAGGAFAQTATDAAADLPPNAKAGECYARVYIPAAYTENTERVLVKPAAQKIDIEPAKYETVEQQVIVEAAAKKLEIVPARYEFVEEVVTIKEASEKVVTLPAQYDDVEEKVLVKAAYTTWKRGTGPIEKIDEATGEIMCLVEIPAEYKTVKKRVLKAPATTRKEVIPAVTKTVRKKVMVDPPKTVEVEIPAKYDTITVQKLVSPAREVVTEIPAEYSEVTKRVKASDGRLEWRSILCETNSTPDLITEVQRALARRGYNPGKIDGVLGAETVAAIRLFQRDKGVAQGQLTMETIRLLGLNQG